MKILVVLLYLLCLSSANVEEALGSGDGGYSLDDDTEEGEDEQYDYSQNKTETVENDEYHDVYYEIVEQDDDTEEGEDEQYDFSQNMTETRDNDDEYYEIVEQTETNRFYFLPSSYPPTKKIFLS